MTMRKSLILTSAALLALIAACGETAAPEAAASATETAATAVSGPKVGDKIGDNDAEKAAKAAERQAAAAEKAAEAARVDAEIAARGVRKVGWEELMPEGEEERLAQMYQSQMATLYSSAPIAEGSAADTSVQIGTFNTVDALNGVQVRIPGYTVPFEYGSKAETIFVRTDTPIKLKDLAQAVWIEGTMLTQTQNSDLADAAYTIEMTGIEKYEY